MSEINQTAIIDLDMLIQGYTKEIAEQNNEQSTVVAKTNQLYGARQVIEQFKANGFVVINSNLLPPATNSTDTKSVTDESIDSEVQDVVGNFS